jgi:ABC-type antimicrobial peptide transport system permease subunit
VGVLVGFLVWVVPMVLDEATRPGAQVGSGSIVPFLAVVGVVMVTGIVACGLPALRALRIEPTEALREE